MTYSRTGNSEVLSCVHSTLEWKPLRHGRPSFFNILHILWASALWDLPSYYKIQKSYFPTIKDLQANDLSSTNQMHPEQVSGPNVRQQASIFFVQVAAEWLVLRDSNWCCNKVEYLAPNNFREVEFLASKVCVVPAMTVAVPRWASSTA